MCFGGEGIASEDKVVQTEMASTVGMLNRDHKKRYKKGVEKGVMDWLKDDSTIDTAANTAATTAAQQIAIGQQVQDNQLARMGMKLTPEQRAVMKAKNDLAGTTTVVNEANKGRAAEVALKKAVRNPMMDLGRQSLGMGMGLYSTAAGMEQERGASNAVEQEKNRQQTLSALSSGGGMALAMMG